MRDDPTRRRFLVSVGTRPRRRACSPLRRALTSALAASFVLVGGALAAAVIAISEVHYHPPGADAKALEFVELHNPGGSAVDLDGWTLRGAVEWTFPAGATIPAGGRVVVARDRGELLRAFALGGEGVWGDWRGALDNDGETITLVDELGAWVDSVRYDDAAPWPADADGGGSSLQRVCPEESGDRADNWTGAFGELPTPLEPSMAARCPLPAPPLASVVINEIHYHPSGDRDAQEEFVELHNATGSAVDVSGWRLEGVGFTLPEGTAIDAGGFLLVARDAAHLRASLGVEPIVGDFPGALSNRGERLALVDAGGALVDVVRYEDSGDWPFAADGGGRSLERIRPSAPGDDPASWSTGLLVPGSFVAAAVVGTLGDLLSQRVVIGVNGPGEFVIDEVSLTSLAAPEVELIPNGGFEEGLGQWEARGNVVDSTVEDGIGVDGSRGLRLVAADACGAGCGDCSSRDSVAYTFRTGDLDVREPYRLSLRYRFVSGSASLYCRLLGGVEYCLGESLISPGAPNSNLSADSPPFVSDVGRHPRRPRSADEVVISARVRSPSGQALESVELTRVLGEEVDVFAMFDDGAHGDAFAGDGVWGARLPSQPHDTAVLYRVTARTVDGGEGVAPLVASGGRLVARELFGYYVDDEQPESALEVWQLLIPGVDPEDPRDINDVLTCSSLETAHFVFDGEVWPDVGVRFRGNTACLLAKRNLKVRFNKGRWFRGLRKLNLQGLWTDKSLVRERLAWEFVRQLGVPYCESEYVRVHLNGRYHGLFLYLEHPDQRFLRRNGLDEDGCLYKAKQPFTQGTPIGVSEQPTPQAYADFWEEETCETGDFGPLAEFVGAMHDDGRSAQGPTAEFFLERCAPEEIIGYQLAQTVLDNIDSFAKNHFLFHDVAAGSWSLYTWDMDLSFGKSFNPAIAPVGTLNDCMLCPGRDLNPWFSTTVLGNQRLHWLIDLFFNAGEGHFQRAYLIRLWDLLQEKYRGEVYAPILAELAARLDAEQAEDIARWGRSPVSCGTCTTRCANRLDMASNLEEVLFQIDCHRDFLERYIRAWHPGVEGHARMKVTEVLASSPDVDDALEYVELLNTTGRAIDVSGWRLTGGVDIVFPEGTLVPVDGVVVAVRSRDAFLARFPEVAESAVVIGDYAGALDADGDTLRLLDSGPGHPATIDLLRYEDGGDWPDNRGGYSIELIAPRPDLDNDDPANWRSSQQPLGTPGRVEERRFVRGDVVEDGELNLSDGVFILDWLFRGGGSPTCRDAADVDDDGEVVLTDAVYLLRYLFLGDSPPPAPFPEPGGDPSPDSISCR